MKNLGMQEYENVITDPIFGNEETCRIWRKPGIPRSHQNLERTTKWREVLQVPLWPISDDERVHDCQCLCQNRFGESHKEQENNKEWQNNNERIKYKMHHRETGLCSFVAGMKQLAYSQEKEFPKSLWNVDWVQVLFLLCANAKVVWPERRPEREFTSLRWVQYMRQIHNIVYLWAAVMSNSQLWVPFPTLFKSIAAAHATLHAAMFKSHVPAKRTGQTASALMC